MIIVKMLGVDADLAPSLIRDVHNQVAQAFETEPEEVLFYVPSSTLYFRGVDQTSYQIDIEIEASKKYLPIQESIAKAVIGIFKESHVHVRVVFTYFDKENEFNYVNEDYPRYMTEENMAHFEAIDSEEEGEAPYMGDAFKDYGERVEQKEKEQAEEEKARQSKRTDKAN